MKSTISAIVCLVLLAVPQSLAQSGADLAGLAQVKDAISKRASSSDPSWATGGNADARPIAPGGTLVLADLEGPGVINHIWFTIAAPEAKYPRLLALRMYWDDETNPSVEAPVGDFFAMGHGLDVPLESLPVSVTADGRARNCYWPMPFGKRARIEVTNEGTEPVHAFYYYIDWEQVESLPADTAYFHAMYRQEYPARADSRYMYADIEGRGHYVGTVHSARARTDSWIGEGDDFFYIDGETDPSLKGTGTEDYYCDAWGFREMTRPFYGAPLFEGFEKGDRTTVYRWHITDPIRFSKSLFAEIEHVGPQGLAPDGTYEPHYGVRLDDISSVAYWYQIEPHKPWEPMPVGAERLYPEDVAALHMQPDAYPPYIELALQQIMYSGTGSNIVIAADKPGANFTLHLANPTQLPAHVVVNLIDDGPLRPSKSTYEADLAPGDESSVPIAFEGAESVPVERMQPVRVRAEYRFDHPSGTSVTIPQDRRVIFSSDYTPEPAPGAIAIDGDLSEWGELVFEVTQPADIQMDPSGWEDANDCRWTFGVRSDDAFLYVAIDVIDDELVLHPDLEPWAQDGVELRIAAMPEPDLGAYKGGDEFGKAVLFAMSPNRSGDAQAHQAEQLPEGSKYACVPTTAGFAAEVAVPIAWLNAQQGKPWESFRLNIAIDDRDGDQQTQLWWRPDWRRDHTFTGSGTFRRP